jgi:phosphatidate cytidylyltransferase
MAEKLTVRKDRSTFIRRLVVTLVGVPAVAAVVWFDRPIPWLTLLGVIWGMAAVFEFYRIVDRSKGVSPLTYFGMVWVALFIISPHIKYEPTISLLLTSAVILPLIFLLWRKGKENAFTSWAWTIAGILYIGWILSYLIALRNLENGRDWVILAMGCTFASDICAYLVGRAIGKHKLAPYISPKKTWEGSAGGALGAIVISILVVWGFGLPVSFGEAVILGLLISAAGQIGDLIKSLFKRNTGVKDSSQVIPGHGGFLDRVDSQAFAGVAVYLYVFYLVLGG